MAKSRTVAGRLRSVFEALGIDLPIALKGWDGSRSGPADVPALVLRHPRALRRLLWQPNQLGLGRAWVAGELDVEGDLYELLRRLENLLTLPADETPRAGEVLRGGGLRDLLALGAVGPQPPPPPEEARLTGVRHSPRRDRRAISHHYDVGNDFYRLVLGESMVYSCAYWTSAAAGYGLDDAQRDKLALICRKLALERGMRLLDVGCGWGSLAIHAAREHGVSVLGLTISQEQADLARKRVAEAGLSGQVEIRLQDYREVDDGPFDAVASIGMAEHVGVSAYAEYAAILFRQLRRGGRLLNHQIATALGSGLAGTDVGGRRPPTSRTWRSVAPAPSRSVLPRRAPAPSFIEAYVFPDGELASLGTTVNLLEGAGFEVRDVESLREHYARTLRAWVANLEENWAAAVRLASAGRARVWRMYMAGSAVSFEAGRIGVNQVLAVRPHLDGRSAFPPTRDWLA
jgi:cyclopropane-fatty-acyl-phospholipid synthase